MELFENKGDVRVRGPKANPGQMSLQQATKHLIIVTNDIYAEEGQVSTLQRAYMTFLASSINKWLKDGWPTLHSNTSDQLTMRNLASNLDLVETAM